MDAGEVVILTQNGPTEQQAGNEATKGVAAGSGDTELLCGTLTADGGRCRAPRLRGGSFCYFHEPTYKDKRHEEASRGGTATAERRKLLLGAVDLSSPAKVTEFLTVLVGAVLTGAVPPTKADTACRIAEASLRVRSGQLLEERLAVLEETLGRLEGQSDGGD